MERAAVGDFNILGKVVGNFQKKKTPLLIAMSPITTKYKKRQSSQSGQPSKK